MEGAAVLEIAVSAGLAWTGLEPSLSTLKLMYMPFKLGDMIFELSFSLHVFGQLGPVASEKFKPSLVAAVILVFKTDDSLDFIEGESESLEFENAP